MKKMLETLGVLVALAIVAVYGFAILVLTFDPACGPDGNSQRACQEELWNDVVALVRR